MNEILTVNAVMQKYQAENGEVTALEEISFTACEGEFICIVGPSGCGKSTLLSVIAGLEKATRGAVLIDGQQVSGVSMQVGYMLQRDNLLEWRSIWKNVLLGLEIQRKLTDESKAYAEELLKTYGLYDFIDKYPSQLSGGMRQRVSLIRTLATRPRILLLDEAFSALDFQTRLSVTDDVYRILKNENKTTLMVTHDIPEGISMADRMIVLSRRPGVIKYIHEIRFDESCTLPLARRNSEQFGRYFNEIWRELDVIA
ncbi:MAG: ABC transporter ATP-binding protein [Acetanaerobacterium sp.]